MEPERELTIIGKIIGWLLIGIILSFYLLLGMFFLGVSIWHVSNNIRKGGTFFDQWGITLFLVICSAVSLYIQRAVLGSLLKKIRFEETGLAVKYPFEKEIIAGGRYLQFLADKYGK
jgi:hypothetical protein